MEYSKNFNFALPSSSNDIDLADIDEISENFRKIDDDVVKKENGKGLSTNDFTNEEKQKVADSVTQEYFDDVFNKQSKVMSNKFANAVIGSEIDTNRLTIDDISPIQHDIFINVGSKNKFDFNNTTFVANNTSQIDVLKGDNSYQFTPNAISPYFYANNTLELKPNTTYTSRVAITQNKIDTESKITENSMSLNLYLQSSTGYVHNATHSLIIVNGNAKSVQTGVFEIVTTFTTPNDLSPYNYIVGRLSDNATVSYSNIQIEEGSTATTYSDYIDESTFNVLTCGKNWLNPNSTLTKVMAYYGIYISKSVFPFSLSISLKDSSTVPSGVYFGIVYSNSLTSSVEAEWLILDGEINKTSATSSDVLSEVALENIGTLGIAVYPSTQEAWNSVFNSFNVQLEFGTENTDFEEFNGTYLTTDENGNCESLSYYPITNVICDTDGTQVKCEYNKDINKVIENLVNAIVSLGGNV